MSKKLDPVHQALFGAIQVAQGESAAAMHIIRELLIDVARLHPQPRRYLSDLYDRTISHLEPSNEELNTPQKAPYIHAQGFVESVFSAASKAVGQPRRKGRN